MQHCLSMKNLAAVLHGVNDIRLQEATVPEVGEKDILVKIKHVGICGTDVHFYKEGYIADNYKLDKPIILGHEAVGIVQSIGKSVTNISPGDAVVLEPGIPCSRCQMCKVGRYNLCDDMKFFSVPPNQGFLQNYHVHPAGFAYKIPKEVSLEEATLVEPLAVAIHTFKLIKFSAGQTLLISGAGCLGLLHLLLAKAYGATSVICTDLEEGRLSVARRLGAGHCVKTTANESRKCIADKILDEVRRSTSIAIDAAVDCTGAAQAIQTAIYAVKTGGSIALVGMAAHDMMNIPVITASIKELKLIGVRRYANCFPLALELIRTKRVKVENLVTHRFPLSSVSKAINIASSRNQHAIKVIVDC